MGDLTGGDSRPLVQLFGLKQYFPITRGVIFSRTVGVVKAVDGVSFSISRGETLGLVGESGCGKSTTGRAILQLYRPTAGSVKFDGAELTELDHEELAVVRPRMQMVFQDSYSSLNPRHSVGKIIAEPLVVNGGYSRVEIAGRVKELLELVGLDPMHRTRFPHEFSGGQRQRVGIARALALNPDFVVGDEPISALDVSIQAQVVNLLQRLQRELRLTYLFIAHDLSMVRHISNRVAVMYLGKIMELAANAALFGEPLHPYTQSLISAVPLPDPKAERERKPILLKGDLPSPSNPPLGCVFHTRCPIAQQVCSEKEPEFREVRPGHWAACHFAE